MSYVFPSEDWMLAYKDALNTSEEFAKAGANWHEGPIVLVLPEEQPAGIDKDWRMWLELDGGKCDDIKLVTEDEARDAPFVVTTNYARWKQVMQKELDPVKGMMQGKLKLVGHLPTIVRHVKAAQKMVECVTDVSTDFVGE
ncbi:MAG: hypothetical protein GY845_38385 [Planctomycetes bacterium]|nr:hypothetical protein [Planctomycetota bacterium]